VASPQLVGAAVKALDDDGTPEATYEATESKPSKYEERFLVDAGLVGGGWVRVQPGQYRVLGSCGEANAAASDDYSGDAQMQLEVDWKDPASGTAGTALTGGGDGVQWQRLCPLRMLSLDVLHTGGIRQLHQPDPNQTAIVGLTWALDVVTSTASADSDAKASAFHAAIFVQPGAASCRDIALPGELVWPCGRV
jgi:hypothetical protein